MPVRIGAPTDISGLIDEIEHPSFATSVGLLKHAKQLLEENESGGQTSVLSSLPKFDQLPVKGVAAKVVNWFKSLLP